MINKYLQGVNDKYEVDPKDTSCIEPIAGKEDKRVVTNEEGKKLAEANGLKYYESGKIFSPN